MPRLRVYRREGVVLRQMDYAEADRILTIITPEGKLRALAKGIRRSTSRKVGHLGLFCRSQLLLAQGRNLDIVTQAQCLEEFEGLHLSLERFVYASYVGELVDDVSLEGEDNADLYALFISTLRWLEREEDLGLGTRYFELRLLGIGGYRPELFKCTNCQGLLRAETNFYSSDRGGMLCPRCARLEARTTGVSLKAQKVLRFLQTHDMGEVRNLRLSMETHAEIEALLRAILEASIGRDMGRLPSLKRLRDQLVIPDEAEACGRSSSCSPSAP